jgi:uncharacterized protein
MDKDVLTRIAEALDRLAPPPTDTNVVDAPTLHWDGRTLVPAVNFAPLPLDLLTGISTQKASVLENSRRLAAGHSAHDILLWGARGCGKSALVKSTTAALQSDGADLRLIEVSTAHLNQLQTLFAALGNDTKPTIVYIDDLGFEANGTAARQVRSVLDGGIAARPAHVRLYVTSNRRHIIPRNLAEQDSAINARDVVDDQLALADRFGLSIGFHSIDQDTYLAMVARYAAHLGLDHDPADALLWSAQRGARSGRVAWSYAVELAGRAGKRL